MRPSRSLMPAEYSPLWWALALVTGAVVVPLLVVGGWAVCVVLAVIGGMGG